MGAIESLAEMPRRCPAIPEAGEFQEELRQLHHFSHRIVFAADDPTMTVTVLRVYHAARDRLRDLGRIRLGGS
jgi:plasmid stabilization system protein ParE